MTVKQLYSACQKHKYLLLRMYNGKQMAINCKVAKLAKKQNNYPEDDETDFASFIPCDFITYIHYKTPFIS